ncbi:ABC transporter [Microbacterium sp. 22242]|uniref:ABC transporter n=1 Tax=Microbacterium sp. 22242 TaxID=3453896 RepID=UPI003F84ED99
MSDHEVSKPAQAHDVDDAVAAAPAGGAVEPADETPAAPAEDGALSPAPETEDVAPDHAAVAPDHAAVAQSANESLAEAARAAEGRRDTTEHGAGERVSEERPDDDASAAPARAEAAEKPAVPAEDPDVAAFAEAEASYPGTFGGTFTPPPPRAETPESSAETTAIGSTTTLTPEAVAGETQVITSQTEPRVGEPEPADAAPLPIFVQAPEAPRERGNRGAIFGIGLLAALSFAVLYLGTALGIAAIAGKVTGDSIGTFLQGQLLSAGLWLPVALFAIGFWLLGAIINRGRWGFWVVFGIVVGVFAYFGHVLGAIGSVEFWKLGTTELGRLAASQLLAPLAIAAFIFGRELTIWFGAWAARTGARRTARNEEAQREYERVLEAGPRLPQ